MGGEGAVGSAASAESSSSFPFFLQLLLLVVLSLHAVAVGVWGVAFMKDIARNSNNTGPLTSAELNRRERDRRRAERERAGLAASKME